MQRLRQFLAYAALRVLICVVQALPFWLCEELAYFGAWLFDSVLRVRRKLIDENLRHAFPELSPAERRHLARKMWVHLLLFGQEVALTGRKFHRLNWQSRLRLVGEPAVAAALLDDRPLVLVTAHFGNFELATYALAMFGHHVHSVARPLDNPFLDEFVNRFRGTFGQSILNKQDDYDRIRDIVAAGGKVSFVADQYAGQKGCWVDFFGRPASTHKAIALFALASDAAVLVGGCRRVGGMMQFELRMEGVLDPRELAPHEANVRHVVGWYTRRFEQMIRRAPEQYWWLHRRWKQKRAARKKPSAAAA
ncbi:MAG: lysophospholipid acyltransferase family protein [Planctomycetia bacterium]|nr:lysophospholipid acyltransferase family protein [Planctomycetia bacterium]